MQERASGTVALILVVLAAAVALTIVLGIFPLHDPSYRSGPSTSTTLMPTCPAGPPPTTAGACALPNGGIVIEP